MGDIRVLEIVADGSPGGGTTHALQILRGLAEECSLGLVTQTGSYLWDEARALGVPCFGVNFFRSRLDVRVPIKLSRLVRTFGPQVVHTHGGRAGFFHALAAVKVPIVYTVHGYHFLHKPPLIRWLALHAERLAAHSAECVVFVSHHDAGVARAYDLPTEPEKEVVIHNGVLFSEISQAKIEETKHIGFVGRLEYQKDPLLFLEVVERLPGYAVTIVGNGALGAEMRAEIRRRGLTGVRMLGAQPRAEALKEMSKFGALVMTSRWEGLPMLPLEAMWSGVPVVAVNVGGLGEIIESGKSGLLVDGRSADDLARAVVRLNGDRALRAQIVEEGRNRVREMFAEARMLRKILEVYERVAAL